MRQKIAETISIDVVSTIIVSAADSGSTDKNIRALSRARNTTHPVDESDQAIVSVKSWIPVREWWEGGGAIFIGNLPIKITPPLSITPLDVTMNFLYMIFLFTNKFILSFF